MGGASQPADVAASRPSAARVVWVAESLGYGGDLMYFRDLLAEFRRRFPQGVALVDREFPVDRYPTLPLVPTLTFHVLGGTERKVGGVTYTGEHRLPSLRSWANLVRMRPDVVMVVEFTPTAIASLIAAKVARSRVVLLIESDPSYRGAPSGAVTLMTKRFFARRADTVLVSNRLGERYARESLRVPAQRVVVGPYLTSIPPRSGGSAPEGSRTGLRPPERPARLLFLNSITARKGLSELISALAATPVGARSGWRLDVVGSGAEEAAIREQVRAQGLQDNVEFHGRASFDMTGHYYDAADVVVCPSLADYRSLSGFEAVNAGKPVIISRYDGAHEEIARYAPVARVVDPRDTESFARVLEEFITDPQALGNALDAARAVPTRFSLSAVGDNLDRAVTLASSG